MFLLLVLKEKQTVTKIAVIYASVIDWLDRGRTTQSRLDDRWRREKRDGSEAGLLLGAARGAREVVAAAAAFLEIVVAFYVEFV